MASTFVLGSGRLAAAHADRRATRSSVRPCWVKCEARCSESGQGSSAASAILPGLLAAALLHSSAANAGVVLQKSEGKKLFQGQKKPQAEQPQQQSSGGGGGFSFPSFSAPSLPTPSLPSFSVPSLPSGPSLPKIEGPSLPSVPAPSVGELDPRFLALPGAIGFIGGLAFLASKLDSEFGTFINEGMVKDSTNFTGYEEDEPQARGSPIGFLGLGNLYADALPQGVGQAVTSKARDFAGKGSNKIPIPKVPLPGGKASPRSGGTKRVKGQKGQGKKKGLFGLF